MKTPTTTFTNRVFFGTRRIDNTKIYMSAPVWECGYYWSFGILGNIHESYHLSQHLNCGINMYDSLKLNYELNENISKNLWVFCELVKTAYTLLEVSELYHNGGSNYTSNPCALLLINNAEYKRINEKVLSTIFNRLGDLMHSGIKP